MRTIIFFLAGLTSVSALAAAPCAPSPTALCLNGNRFSAQVSWKDSHGRTGVGTAVSLTSDTGYFWFFGSSNVELIVKVLDARSLNGKFWVFFGALSSVQYDLKVTDTSNGASKTYHNPLGQFASVGDTSAFAGDVGAPAVTESVVAEGMPAPSESMDAIQRFIDAAMANTSTKSAGDFTPCPGPLTTLFLAGCRFQVDVEWTDSHGRVGAGTAVQLSADTGYFWFFGASNVELMVKVLDARPLNGNFWVFFGALSNVEYTLHVTDTISGELHTYRNPASHFASVGDTAAFRGGNGITVALDSARAVSDLVSAESGGSLSATAADGTVFTLNFPAGSLYVSEPVTLTPVASAANLPFAGGLSAGVDIQPAGVALLEGATLSIHTPAPISPTEETPVAWNGSGEDFFLFPPLPASGDLQVRIFHLGGYGVARATDAERGVQLGREPISDEDLFSHQLSTLARSGRAAAASTSNPAPAATDWRADTTALLDAQYQALKAVMEAASDPRDVVHLVRRTNAWRGEVDSLLGSLDTVFPGRNDEIRLLFKEMIERALQKIHQRCTDDPIAIFDIFPIVGVVRSYRLNQFFPELDPEIDAVFTCLRFTLRFESTIAISAGGQTQTYTVLADGIRLGDNVSLDNFVIDGQGSIDHTTMTWTGLPDLCHVTFSQSASTLTAEMYWNPSNQIVLNYDPGQPHSSAILTCRGFGAGTTSDAWSSYYAAQRASRFPAENGTDGYRYLRGGWTITGGRDPWAIKIVPLTRSAGGVSVAEYTIFTLTHTPE